MSSHTNEARLKFVEKRTVLITGSVTRETWHKVMAVMSDLLFQGAPDIAIIFDSNGGECKPGLDLYDLFNTYPGTKTGIVISRAHSIATVILQACDVRICAQHADILIHNIQAEITLETASSPKKFAEWLKGRKYVQDRIHKILAGRTDKTISRIAKECRKDKAMNSKEALDFGLIDRLLTKKDLTKWFRPEALEEFHRGVPPKNVEK